MNGKINGKMGPGLLGIEKDESVHVGGNGNEYVDGNDVKNENDEMLERIAKEHLQGNIKSFLSNQSFLEGRKLSLNDGEGG